MLGWKRTSGSLGGSKGNAMSDSWTLLDGRISRVPPLSVIVGVLLLACLVGGGIPLYVGAIGDGMMRLMALPALILLLFLFLLNKRALLLMILVFRASADLLFEQSKLSLGGQQLGVGALVNLAVLGIAILLVVEEPGVVPKRTVAIMWTGFLLTAFIGMLMAPLKVEAARTYLVLTSYLAIFVSAFYFVKVARDFGFCVRIVLWSSLIPTLFALVDIALHAGDAGLSEFRLQSTFTHANILAFYLTLVIALVLYVLKSATFQLSFWKRTGLVTYMLYLLVLLLLTQTRSAWVACFAIFFVYGLMFERRYLVYLILTPMLALLIPSIRERLIDLTMGNEYIQYAQLNSFAWRRMIWETGLKWMEPERYLLGYGIDSFKYYAPIFFPLAGKVNWGAHSVYVQWLFEVGILGLFSYLWLFGRLLWLLRQMSPSDKLGAFLTISLIIEYLTISFSDNMFAYLAFNWYFWFILGAGCAVIAVVKKQSDDEKKSSTPVFTRLRPNTSQHG